MEEINVLDELCKGASMGIDAISFIMDKVDDKNLKKELKNQLNKYNDIKDEIFTLYPDYSDKSPHETSALNKIFTWYGISIKTTMDDSTSKISELLIKGTNMGIIEGRKLLNHKDTDKKIENLINKYVKMQEEAVEKLKEFL